MTTPIYYSLSQEQECIFLHSEKMEIINFLDSGMSVMESTSTISESNYSA